MYVKTFYSDLEGNLQECGDFTWRVSDCEELSGGYSHGYDVSDSMRKVKT